MESDARAGGRAGSCRLRQARWGAAWICAMALAAAAVLPRQLAADEGSPSTPGPMMAVLDQAAYAAAAQAVMAGRDASAMLASAEPDCGILITEIDPGSQAEKLGMAPGTRILAVNRDYAPDLYYLGHFGLLKVRPLTMTVWIPGIGERMVQIEEGKIGVSWENRPWRAELTYGQGNAHPAAGDADMLVACLAGDAIDLRESALARAARSGAHPTPWYSLAAGVASSRGHFEDAIAYGHLALEHESDRSAKFRIGPLIENAALACDRIAEARAVMASLQVAPHTHMDCWYLVPDLDKVLARRAAAAALPVRPPLPPAAPLKALGEALADVSDRMLCAGDRGPRVTASLHQDRSLSFKVPRGRRMLCPLGPAGHDGSFSAIVTYDLTTGKKEESASFCGFGLCRTESDEKVTILYQVNLDEDLDGMTTIAPPGYSECFIHPATPNGLTIANHVRLTAIADRIECEVNGIIVYRAHIDDAPDRRLGCFVMMQQVSGTCREVRWRIDAPSAAAAPPLPPLPPLPPPAAKTGADDF